MKIPKPEHLPSGSWRVRLRLGGESISITEPTEQAAIKKAQLVKAEHLAGRPKIRRDTSPTLDKMIENYISAKKAVLSPSTVRGYEAYRRSRFQAYKNRDPEKINWQRMVSDEARICGPKTLKNAWALVAAAIAFSGDVAPAVTLPQVVSDEHPYLEAEQIPAFLDAIRDTPWELPALLGLHGLRRSEAFALTWEDIDLPSEYAFNNGHLGEIHVRGALVHDADGKLVKKKENKNRSSRRTVPIMIGNLTRKLLAVPQEDRTGRVLTSHPNSAYKAINTICEKAGLPLVGYHGLRHSFASLAHSLGVPEQETMALGGWEDPNTMRKIYTHLDNAARLKAANAITEFYTGK